MATRPVNLRLDETQVSDVKQVASVFGMTFTDLVREAIQEYLPRKKEDPFYRLTANVEEVSDEENVELTTFLDTLTEDDLEIVKTERIEY